MIGNFSGSHLRNVCVAPIQGTHSQSLASSATSFAIYSDWSTVTCRRGRALTNLEWYGGLETATGKDAVCQQHR